MIDINFDRIPAALSGVPQWVLWKYVDKGDGKSTKVPFGVNGRPASSTNAETWSELHDVAEAYNRGGYEGVGFVFLEGGGLCGVDLDGCRNPDTGEVAEWAKKIILDLDTYAEVSPSRTGVKLFLQGKSPLSGGKKKELTDAQRMGDKNPAVEVYDRGRYFAVTGWKLKGPDEPQSRQDKLSAMCFSYFPPEPPPASYIGFQSDAHVADRARKYLAKLPPAISGQGGHNAAFHAACVLVLGFGLDDGTALALMREWNSTCSPPWSDRELRHKVNQAAKHPGERNYLRNTPTQRWDTVTVPKYTAKAEAGDQPEVISVADAGRLYIAAMRSGATELITTGLGSLDYALGGGVAKGEYVAMAARPSHGKSMVAMQCVHQWASQGLSSFVVSAEMSAMALGKRVLHFISDAPEDEWSSNLEQLEREVEHYERTTAKSYIIADCNSADQVCDQIEAAIDKYGVKAAVVDYVQLLKAPGNQRSDQVAYTSGAFKSLAKRRNITLLLLCQMGRKVEARPKFIPTMSDLEHSSKLEQDADVILFLVWPFKLDATMPKNEYQIWVAKNRNRAINEHMVECQLLANRQMVVPKNSPVASRSADASFDDWNKQ